MINVRSAFWAITILLFLGGLGIPVPENPALMGGGYALHKHLSLPLASLFVWYLAVMAGDSLLFAFFSPDQRFQNRWSVMLVGKGLKNIGLHLPGELVGRCFWLDFDVRALVYLAAGAARYPWQRFLAVDGVSVTA